MKFKINNREWKITETSQESIKNKQNIRRANEEENHGNFPVRGAGSHRHRGRVSGLLYGHG